MDALIAMATGVEDTHMPEKGPLKPLHLDVTSSIVQK